MRRSIRRLRQESSFASLDTAGLMQRRDRERTEAMGGATTSANAGAYAVPLGGVLTRADLVGAGDDESSGDTPADVKGWLDYFCGR